MTAPNTHRIRAKLSYANVTATLALVLALGGGTAWAASKIRTRQIAYHAVTGAKLDTNAVTASKIRNGSVGTDDVKDGSLLAATWPRTRCRCRRWGRGVSSRPRAPWRTARASRA